MDAIDFFTAQLAFRTDVADVATELPAGGFVLVDTRALPAWEQGHVPGAVHLPRASIEDRAACLLDPDRPVVTYCWGPGCDGATKAALQLARMGFRVREMIGGYEYWVREGLPVETALGVRTGPPDPLTVPIAATGTKAPTDPTELTGLTTSGRPVRATPDGDTDGPPTQPSTCGC